jgi:hypothetical protein
MKLRENASVEVFTGSAVLVPSDPTGIVPYAHHPLLRKASSHISRS